MPDVLNACAKMGANLFWAYIGHEGNTFPSPIF